MKWTVPACVAGVVLALGCAPGRVEAWEALPASPLPSLQFPECDADPPSPPGACDWALSADGIYWGTLIDLRLVNAPAFVVGGERVGAVVAQCDGIVEPAMELVLEVEDTLRGSAPSTVTVRLGADHRHMLRPTPYHATEEAGGLRWEGTGGAPLAVGQKLGVVAHAHAGGLSLMGSPLFGVAVDDSGSRTISFQARESAGCEVPPPVAFEGKTLAEMKAIVAACPASSASAEQLRTRRRNTWGPEGSSPSRSYTANCFNL